MQFIDRLNSTAHDYNGIILLGIALGLVTLNILFFAAVMANRKPQRITVVVDNGPHDPLDYMSVGSEIGGLGSEYVENGRPPSLESMLGGVALSGVRRERIFDIDPRIAGRAGDRKSSSN